jgi:hypothetical protein
MFRKLFRKKEIILLAVFASVFCAGIAACKHSAYSVATAAQNRKLPIYCVDTQGKKQVAISFDAAWGAGRLRRSFFIHKQLCSLLCSI